MMKMMMLKKLTLAILVAATVTLGGCNILGPIGPLIAPEPTVTVEPEYTDLPGHSIAVVVYADISLEYEYPNARRELTAYLSQELVRNVKNLTAIDPMTTLQFQEQNLSWADLDRTEIGRRLGGDYVLFVSLMEFSMREKGSADLYRGRIAAEVNLYKTSLPEYQASVWRNSDIRVMFPEDKTASHVDRNDIRIRIETERQFVDQVVKKFYRHKVPKE